jgi:hypothetical protein
MYNTDERILTQNLQATEKLFAVGITHRQTLPDHDNTVVFYLKRFYKFEINPRGFVYPDKQTGKFFFRRFGFVRHNNMGDTITKRVHLQCLQCPGFLPDHCNFKSGDAPNPEIFFIKIFEI